MNTNQQEQFGKDTAQGGGVVWDRLQSERNEVCWSLLHMIPPVDSVALFFSIGEAELKERLQDRLRLIDEVLDRLGSGSYGDCTVCKRWIEDTRLEVDPATPVCFSCARDGRKSGGIEELAEHSPHQSAEINSKVPRLPIQNSWQGRI
jgi:hypothetical protein